MGLKKPVPALHRVTAKISMSRAAKTSRETMMMISCLVIPEASFDDTAAAGAAVACGVGFSTAPTSASFVRLPQYVQ